ncbi:MAG: proprotein convertase P-domain-containing protein [Bacteroidota bacterium]|jgi:subtilisin-like proprotein convertase family protein
MKVVRLSVALVALAFLCSLTANAQLNREFEYFRAPAAPIVDFSTTTSSIDVPDIFKISSLSVLVDIDHAAASDLTITLTGPTGTYTLSTQNGLAGANYENTIFDSNPGIAIPGVAINAPGNVTAYFRGVYTPESTLPTTGNGTGLWTLNVTDNLVADNGTLVRWGLIFNRYDNYRDIRWGIDLNFFGVTTLNPIGLIDDVTGIPPYTVLGYRPLNNQALAVASYQLSQTPGIANLTIDHKVPGGSKTQIYDGDLSIPAENAYAGSFSANLNSQRGIHETTLDFMMRADLWTSRPDNNKVVLSDVTPGSLAYDNGMVANTLFPFVNECDANVYLIAAPQTITSVDVWQSSVVEFEPVSSASRISLNVWDANTGTLVATTGPQVFPPQGDKWVSYPFSPPVTIPAGQYRIGTCLVAVDGASFGPGLGMDQMGSPFEPLGFLSKYAGFNLQQFSFDGGSSWSEDAFRIFNTKMIRPNFVQQSDNGVIAITQTNGFGGLQVSVTFGAYAHYSWLPNQVTFGKVTIINNVTGLTVGYLEKRVYLLAAPYVATEIFTFPQLASGNYTIRAEIVRPDDENLINNAYERTVVIPFAPMSVYYDGSIAQSLRDQVSSTYAQQGIAIEFVDRSVNEVTFTGEKVLWIGDLDKPQAQQAREYALQGGDFSVLPTGKSTVNPLTSLFTQVASVKELDAMNRVLVAPSDVKMPETANSMMVQSMSDPTSPLNVLGKADFDRDIITDFYTWVKNSKTAPTATRDPRTSVIVSGNDEVRATAERIGDLSIVKLLVKDARPANRRVNDIADASSFEVTQNYPNPFNPTTNIAFNVPADANVSVRVYDMLGREIATLVNGSFASGRYITTWDANNNLGQTVSSGLYFYRMEAQPVDGSASFVGVKKMVLTR